MNEANTRKEIIDSRLKQAGWNVHDKTQVVEEFFISVENNVVNEPTTSYSSEFSDYVLLGKDGKPLAVVEAKKSSVDARIGKEQAAKTLPNTQTCKRANSANALTTNSCFRNGIFTYFDHLKFYSI